MTEERKWMEGPGFVAFLRRRGLRTKSQLTEAQIRRTTEWEKGAKVNFYTADPILVRLGLNENDIPDDLWTSYPKKPQLTKVQRKELVGRVKGGKCCAEVAREFGCTEKSARYHVAKAEA